MMWAAGVVAALVVAGPAQADKVVAVDFDGCHSVVDETTAVDILRIELAAENAAAPQVELLSPSSPAEALRVHVSCLPETLTVSMSVSKGLPRILSLVDTTLKIRPRTLALALAEQVRLAQFDVPIELKPPPALPPMALMPPCDEQCRQDVTRKKLAGDWALGLGIAAGVGLAVGAPIAAVGDAHSSDGSLRGAGAAILGISVAPLVGAAVAFTIWLMTPSHTTAVVPAHQ